MAEGAGSAALEEVQRLLDFPKSSLSDTLLQPRLCDGLIKLYAPYVKAAGNASPAQREQAGAVMEFIGELATSVSAATAAPKSVMGTVLQSAAHAVFVAVLQTIHAELGGMSSQKQLHNSLEDILTAIDGLNNLSAPAAKWTKAFTTEGAGDNKANLLDTIAAKMCDNLQSGFLTVFAVEILYHLHACAYLTRNVVSCVDTAVPKQHVKRLRALLRVDAGDFKEGALTFARAVVGDLCTASTSGAVEAILSGDNVKPVSLRSSFTAAGTAELSLFLRGNDDHPVVSVPVGAIHRPHLVETNGKAPMKLVFSTDAAPMLNAADADANVAEVDVTIIFAKGDGDAARQLAAACGCAARSTHDAAKAKLSRSSVANENASPDASRDNAASSAAARSAAKKAPLTPTETTQPKATVAATAPKKITAAKKAALAPASTTSTTATTAASKKTTTKKAAAAKPATVTTKTAATAPAAAAAALPSAYRKTTAPAVTAKTKAEPAAKKVPTAAATKAATRDTANAKTTATAAPKAAATENAISSQPSVTQKPVGNVGNDKAQPVTEAVSAAVAAVPHNGPTPASSQTRLVMRMLESDDDDDDDDVSNTDGTSPEHKTAVAAPAPSRPAAAAFVTSVPEQRGLLFSSSGSDSSDSDSSDDASAHDSRDGISHPTGGSLKHDALPSVTTGTGRRLGQLSTAQQRSFGQGTTSPSSTSTSTSTSASTSTSSSEGGGDDDGSTSTSTSGSSSEDSDADNEDGMGLESTWKHPPRTRGVSLADQFSNNVGVDGCV
jgi:hypothetical protein